MITISQPGAGVGNTVVIDIGKTLSKASLWTPDGRMVARLARANERVAGPGWLTLDVEGIDEPVSVTLSVPVIESSSVQPVAESSAPPAFCELPQP